MISKDRTIAATVKGLIRSGGWQLIQGGRHLKLRHANGYQTLVPRDAGCPRARQNFAADLRRAERGGFGFRQHGYVLSVYVMVPAAVVAGLLTFGLVWGILTS